MKRILAFMCAALILTACHDASKDPVIKGYRLQPSGGMGLGANGVTAGLVLNLDVENPSSASYTLEALRADVYRGSETSRFAEVTMPESASIAPRSSETVSIPLQELLLRPLALLSGGEDALDLAQYVADIDLTIRKGSLKKRVQKERVPLKDLKDLLGNFKTTETK